MGKLNIEITERDLKILNVLKKFGCLREDLLAKYLNVDYGTKNGKYVFHVLAGRLKKYDVIARNKILHGGKFYWTIGKFGAQLVNASLYKGLSLITINHDDLVAELAINYLNKNPEVNLVTEYESRHELFGKEAKEKKLPDIILNDIVAIEVELTPKDDRRVAAIINNYVNSNYTTVIYYTNSISVINKISKYTKNNTMFRFKKFTNSILDSEDYIPKISADVLNRNDKDGKFKSDDNNALAKILNS